MPQFIRNHTNLLESSSPIIERLTVAFTTEFQELQISEASSLSHIGTVSIELTV